MAFGAKAVLPRPFTNLLRRVPARSFTRSTVRINNGAQHTYFQRDSPVIRFPQQSQYADYTPAYEQPQSFPTKSQIWPERELLDARKWLIFLAGFAAFPVALVAYYYAYWAVGTKLYPSELKQLEEQGLTQGARGILKGLQESKDQFMEANNLYSILQRANAETKALHDLILAWINPENGLHAAKDTALLMEHPIKMSDGKLLEPHKAILIRILDKKSKTVVLLLGVDMTGHKGSESDPALAWCHDYALRNWMDERAEQITESGEAPEQGISLYCYTATSSATSLPGKKGEIWQEARLEPEDLPSGFPLKVLEGVKEELSAESP